MKDTLEMKQKYLERLKKIIASKIQTTMIFPLSQFETEMGHIWGIGLSGDKLTDEQRFLKEKWEKCRQNILDMGNRQIRNAMSELNQYEVQWKRFQTRLVPISKLVANGEEIEDS